LTEGFGYLNYKEGEMTDIFPLFFDFLMGFQKDEDKIYGECIFPYDK